MEYLCSDYRTEIAPQVGQISAQNVYQLWAVGVVWFSAFKKLAFSLTSSGCNPSLVEIYVNVIILTGIRIELLDLNLHTMVTSLNQMSLQTGGRM